MIEEKRKGGIRRDLNGLVRGKDGEISGGKLGTYLAQYIAAKMLLGLGSPLPGWDTLMACLATTAARQGRRPVLQCVTAALPVSSVRRHVAGGCTRRQQSVRKASPPR